MKSSLNMRGEIMGYNYKLLSNGRPYREDHKPKGQKLAIKFGDNDFYFTFMPLLDILSESPWFDSNFDVPKECWAEIINRLSAATHVLFQSRPDMVSYGYSALEEELKTALEVRDYVKISPEQILIGEEVDEYLANVEWDNGETFVVILNEYGKSVVAV